MARTIEKTFTSFLSTAVFFATFLIAGDILIAVLTAVATAIVQAVLRRTAHQRTALIWASLATVLALTGLSLKGDDATAATLSAAQITRQMHQAVSRGGCHVRTHAVEARLTASPSL